MPPVSDTFDASQTDTPAGAAAVNILYIVLVHPLAQFTIGVIGLSLILFLVLRDARAQIPGTLFAIVSFVAVLVATLLLAALIQNRTPALKRLIYGPPIASPKSPQRRLLQL
jgi:hypothetical protein